MSYSFIEEKDVIEAIKAHQKGEFTVKEIATSKGVSSEGLGDRMRSRGYSPKKKMFIKKVYEKEPPLENKHKELYNRILYNQTLSYQPN